MTVVDLPARAREAATVCALSAAFAHAIGLDEAVRSAMEPPLLGPGRGGPHVPAASPEIEAIKARLAARGLLVSRPRTAPSCDALPDPVGGAAFVPDDVDAVISLLDEWDVAAGRDETPVRCRQCRDTFMRPLDASRFVCPACDRAWRWAVCSSCDQLGFTVERQESWRCGCGAFNRSWWRTSTARRDALEVVARRRGALLETERRLTREGMRRRRWKLVALAVCAATAAAGLVVGARVSQSEAGGTAVACGHWMRLRPSITNGTLVGDALEREIERLTDEAATAAPAVAQAANELAAARVGSTAFLAARARLGDVCEAR